MARRLMVWLALTIATLLPLNAIAQRGSLLGLNVGAASATSAYAGPCDILATAGTPCVAAYSFTRAMTASYLASGNPAFAVERASDSSTLNVGFNSNGSVNQSAWTAFCSGTTCNYSKLCDQITGHCVSGVNDLPQATVANQAPLTTVTYGGSTFPIWSNPAKSGSNYFLRNRTNTSGIPTGAASITEYYVRTKSQRSNCCGDFGNMETTVADTGTGHMFALEFGYNDTTQGQVFPANIGIDHENGNYYFFSAIPTAFDLIAKHSSVTSDTTIKVGNAWSGPLTTLTSGSDPVTYDMEGGLSLGEGGDGTPASDSFFEGAVIASATTDATDNSLQSNITAFYAPVSGCTSLGTYTGPIDIVSGPNEWYGVRSGSSPYATGCNAAFSVFNQQTSNVGDINILTSGSLDTTGLSNFSGVDATASCTVSGTSAPCTGASSAPHLNDTVTGVGLAKPCIVSAVGTFTGGAGSVTIELAQTSSSCGTVAVGETLTFTNGVGTVVAYDNSGNGVDLAQNSGSNFPQLLPDCGDGEPCLWFSGGKWLMATTGVKALTQPFTASGVLARIGSTAAYNDAFFQTDGTCDTSAMNIAFNDAANGLLWGTCGGSGTHVLATMTDGVFSSFTGINATGSGASRNVINGSSTTGTITTTAIGTSAIFMGTVTPGDSTQLHGYIHEMGLWNGAFTSGEYTGSGSVCHNAYLFYGSAFPASC